MLRKRTSPAAAISAEPVIALSLPGSNREHTTPAVVDNRIPRRSEDDEVNPANIWAHLGEGKIVLGRFRGRSEANTGAHNFQRLNAIDEGLR